MGIYDRDYYQESETSSGRWNGASAVTKLIVICGAVALVDLLTDETRTPFGLPGRWLTNHLALPSNLFQMPWNLWKLLTYGFAHESLSRENGIWHVVWNMWALWLFGRAVEGVYGAREFIRIYLVLIVGAGLAWLLCYNMSGGRATVMVGASGAVAGITLLFILHFPHVKFMMLFIPVPMPAWVLGIILIGLDIRGAMGYRQDNVAFSAHLGGFALAYLYFRSGIRLTNFLSWKFPRWRTRPKLRVRRAEEPRTNLERDADRILAKLHEQGAESLTSEERRLLNEYSRRVRQRNQ